MTPDSCVLKEGEKTVHVRALKALHSRKSRSSRQTKTVGHSRSDLEVGLYQDDALTRADTV